MKRSQVGNAEACCPMSSALLQVAVHPGSFVQQKTALDFTAVFQGAANGRTALIVQKSSSASTKPQRFFVCRTLKRSLFTN